MSVTFTPRRSDRTLLWAGGVLGFALGGFFDGILLHQILQWHHFLSLVPGDRFRDLRMQVLGDGLFHVAVYLFTLLGLTLLWRGRAGFTATDSDQPLLASALLGFSVWQFTDGIIFHWLVGLHRIRVDVPNPLTYDIGWLVLVGLPPLFMAWRLRGSSGTGPGGVRRARNVAIALAILTIGAGPFANLPPRGDMTRVAVFPAGTGAARSFAAVGAVAGRVIWVDWSGDLVAFEASPETRSIDLYGLGAILVGNSAFGAGCVSASPT